MADPYAFDLKIDVAKTRQWSQRVNRQRHSGGSESDNDSDGLDDFLDDDEDDGDDHVDVSDSASFSDSESGKYRRQLQPTTADSPVFPGSRDSLNSSSVGFGAGVESRMDPEQKAALSGSVQGMIQTRHDLDTIRWSQDSAVRAAMEEAEKGDHDTPVASAVASMPFAGARSSKPSLGVRASMQSAGALKEDDDEDEVDEDASDVSSYNGSLSVSASPSFRSSARPASQHQQQQPSTQVPAPAPLAAETAAINSTAKASTTARAVVPSVPAKPINTTGLASPYSDVYTSDPDVGENDDDDEYGDESEESAADPTAAWRVSTTPAKPAAGGDDDNDDGDGYEDEDAYEEDGYEDDESPRPSPTHASRSSQNPPAIYFPTSSSISGGGNSSATGSRSSAGGVSAAEVKRLVAKFARLGKAEFDSWDDEEGEGVCAEEEVAQHLNEYWDTFGLPLRVEACVALRNRTSGNQEVSTGGIAGEALGRALFAAVGAQHGYVDASGTSISSGDDGDACTRLADLERFLIDANADLDNPSSTPLSAPSSSSSSSSSSSAPVSPKPSSTEAPPLPPAPATAAAPPQRPSSPPPKPPPAPPPLFSSESPPAPDKAWPAPAREANGDEALTPKEVFNAKPQGSATPSTSTRTARPLSPPPPPDAAAFCTATGVSTTQSSPPAAAATMAVHEEDSSNRSAHSSFAPQMAQTWQQQQQQQQHESYFAATHATTTTQPISWSLRATAEHPFYGANHPTSALPLRPQPSIPNELKPYLSSSSNSTGAAPEAEAQPLVELSLEVVENLLWGLGFGDCATAMVETHCIDGSLLSLVETSEDLKELGVGVAVKRKKLLNLLFALQHPRTAPHGVPKALLKDGQAKKKAARGAVLTAAATEKAVTPQSGTAGSASGGGIGYREGERFHDRSRLKPRLGAEDEATTREKEDEAAWAKQAAEEAQIAAEAQAQATAAAAVLKAGEAAEAESEATFTRQSNEAAASALHATQQHGVAHPLWAPGASSATSSFNDHGLLAAPISGAPDPTLPMARVYLRLLAEAQAEATAAKRQVAELTWELNALRNGEGAVPQQGSLPLSDAHKPAASLSETATKTATPAGETGTATTAAGPNSLGNENDTSASRNHSSSNNSNLGQGRSFMNSISGGATRLTMQHATRQALLRRQYDLLREQLTSAQRAADFHGRNAHITNTASALTTTSNPQGAFWRHLQHKPLTMEEALRRVDAGLG